MYPEDAFTVYRNGGFLCLGVVREDGILMTVHPDQPSDAVIDELQKAIVNAPSLQETTVVIEGETYLIEGRVPVEEGT